MLADLWTCNFNVTQVDLTAQRNFVPLPDPAGNAQCQQAVDTCKQDKVKWGANAAARTKASVMLEGEISVLAGQNWHRATPSRQRRWRSSQPARYDRFLRVVPTVALFGRVSVVRLLAWRMGPYGGKPPCHLTSQLCMI
jgi:hypothetical protein